MARQVFFGRGLFSGRGLKRGSPSRSGIVETQIGLRIPPSRLSPPAGWANGGRDWYGTGRSAEQGLVLPTPKAYAGADSRRIPPKTGLLVWLRGSGLGA